MKKRLIGATLLTVLVALLVSGAMGVWVFHQREMDGARRNLKELLVLMDAQSAITDPQGLARQFMAAAPDKRFTVIETDGTVMADTEADHTEMENHADRAEVQTAAANGWGESIRPSETMGEGQFYVAKRFADGMVGRASMSISSIDGIVRGNMGGFFIAVLVALVVALALAGGMARLVLKPLSAVSGALQNVLDGEGDSALLAPYETDDEVRPLLRYIDKLVERLKTYIQRLRAERDKVNLILECMAEGLILLDGEGNVLAINSSAKRLFGIGQDAPPNSILLLTRSRRLREALHRVQAGGESVVVDMDAAAFEGRSLRMFLSPVSGRQFEGENVGCSILISDVTELKKAESIRSEFTANVSHELKTPLTSIKGFTDMLSSGMVTDGEDRARFLTMIGVEVDRLIDLINDILKISELESVAMERGDEESDALATARDVEELLRPTAQAAGVALTVEGERAMVGLPQGRLKELLLNLMENGVKYSDAGGRVDVLVQSGRGGVKITVSDTGIGIPEEAQKRVFERFYRVDKGRARKDGGTGLGLAIVKHMVALYGGTLSLESEVGKGSTFTVKLPGAGR